MAERPIVAVTRRLPDPVMRELTRKYTCRSPGANDAVPGPVALAALLREADALLCTVTDPLVRELFEPGPLRVRILANFGAGVNHIALDAARRAGIAVTNTPDQLTETTADLTIGLMLMTLRRLGEGERLLRAGHWTGWRPVDLLGHDLHGRNLALVGFGRIGQAVARRAVFGFGMRVSYLSPSGREAPADLLPHVTRVAGLDALLGGAEIVSLHLPATPETRQLINLERLYAMRPGAWLINTARGALVDEAALVAALVGGHLGGAGLDVYEREPAVSRELLELPNVVTLPHMGSATHGAREAMGFRALANLDAFFAGRPLLDPVIVP